MNCRFSLILLLFSIGALLSCSGGEQNSARIELTQPDAFRQALVYDPGNLRVVVSVNNGPPQTFDIGDSSAPVIEISGVRPGLMNDITITWIEVVDDRNVLLSEQSQSFLADGNTIIDARHDYSLFNDDGDEFSNFDERLFGTCVWSPLRSCDTSDVELLTDGDFSLGGTEWTTNGEDADTLAGEYCATAPAESNTWIAYGIPIQLQAGLQYELSFDIKSNLESFARVALLDFGAGGAADPGVVSVGQELPVFTVYQRRSVSFPAGVDSMRTVAITFPNDRTARFCIDNVSLVVGAAT